MDVVFIGFVGLGVLALILDSVPSLAEKYGRALHGVEMFVGVMFVLEYLARIWSAAKRLQYIFSFWGLVDLVAIVPFVFQGFGLAYLRMLRVLRIFAILKVAHYTRASDVLALSLLHSRSKIAVFLLTVSVFVCVLGFTMYTVEPETFPTVPHALWWTIVTITTVGYGDYVPVTVLGKIIAGCAMVMAFGIIAVPTGIVAVEYGQAMRETTRGRACARCRRDQHLEPANYCATCGTALGD